MSNDMKTFNHVHFCYGSDSLENWIEKDITLKKDEPIIAINDNIKYDPKANGQSYLILGDGKRTVDELFRAEDRVYLSRLAITEDLGVFDFKGITKTKPTSAGNKGDVYLYQQTSVTNADKNEPEYYMYLYDEDKGWVEIGNFVDMPQSDWDTTSNTTNAFIKNKPSIKKGTGNNAIIENNIESNKASGDYAHAEGGGTKASGGYSHAEGRTTTASEAGSHAEGYQTQALGRASHAEGYQTIANKKTTHIVATHAEGVGSQATGYGSHAEGYETYAFEYAHSEGEHAQANGIGSHAEGGSTIADGDYSHTEGYMTKAISKAAHASGLMEDPEVPDRIAGCKGYKITDFDLDKRRIFTLETEGINDNWAKGDRVAFDVGSTYTYGYTINLIKENQLRLNAAIPTSEDIIIDKESCIWNLDKPEAGEIDIGLAAFTQGVDTTAIGKAAVALNRETRAEGNFSFAANRETVAGYGAAAFGRSTEARGQHSFTVGRGSVANGDFSYAGGYMTIASGDYQQVQGKYNVEDTSGMYAHIVGGGEKSKRANIYTLDWDGNGWFLGTVKAATPEGNNDLTTKEYVDNINSTLKTVIANEASTARAAELNLNEKIEDAKSELEDSLKTVSDNYNNLSKTVTSENDRIDSKIDDETLRAQGVEEDLQDSIDELQRLIDEAKKEELAIRTIAETAQSKINGFLNGTAEAESAIDTLIEIQNYMTSDTEAFTTLSNRVSTAENKINTLKNDLNSYYTIGDIDTLFVSKESLEAKKYITEEELANYYSKTEVDDLLANLTAQIQGLQAQIDELKNTNEEQQPMEPTDPETPTEESTEIETPTEEPTDPETPTEESTDPETPTEE